jgi:hypothetical protein
MQRRGIGKKTLFLPLLLFSLLTQVASAQTEADEDRDPGFLYLRVFEVRGGGTAEAAGVSEGDFLLLVSGILPMSASHADSLIGFGPAQLSVLRDGEIVELELGLGLHGLSLGGPQAVVASQSVFLDALDPSSFTEGEDARAAGWTAIASFAGVPVSYELMVVASGSAFWSMWFEPGPSITAARSDASWFDRKMAGAAGLTTTSGALDRAVAVARNTMTAGYPAIATGFGEHGTVLVAGYQLFGDTLYGYNRYGQLVGARSCSTVVGVGGVGDPPDPEVLLDGALPFARTLMYMTSWRPTLFDDLGRPETDTYTVGSSCFSSWIDWLESEEFPADGSLELVMAATAMETIASMLAERRSIAATFLDSLAFDSSELSVLADAAEDFSEIADIMESLTSSEMLSGLSSPGVRSEWVSALERVQELEERAVETVMAAP